MKLRGVLLDLDGTLVDQETAATEALVGWLPTLGVEPTAVALTAWFDAQERHLVAWRERRITFQEQRRRRLRDFLPAVGVPYEESSLDQIFEGYLHRYEAAWRIYDDVQNALTAIADAGLRTAVLTNGTVEQQTAKLVTVGLQDRVGPVYTAEELGVAKPSPDAYRSACERWGLPPGAVLHVGDRYDLDVEAARLAGLRAVHLDRRDEGPTTEPCRITSLDGLAAYLIES